VPITPITVKPIVPITPIEPIAPGGIGSNLQNSTQEKNWYENSQNVEENVTQKPAITEADIKGIEEMMNKGEIKFEDLNS